MKNDDDTLRTGRQAFEDAQAAAMKANAIPGLGPVVHFDLDDDESVAAAMGEAAKLGTDALCFYELERAAVKLGEPAGKLAAGLIQDFPENLHGNIVLSFSGFADDPRELFEIRESVTFCRGLLLGSSRQPDLDHAKRTLLVLLDERPYLDVETGTAEDMFIHSAGGMWLVRTAFPDECWFQRDGQIMLDFVMNLTIYNWLIGDGPPPGTVKP